MPVDPNDVHHEKRHANRLFVKHQSNIRLRRVSEKKGALKLSAVPNERCVADAFTIMLTTCEREKFFDRSHFVLPSQRELDRLLREYEHASSSQSAAETRGTGSSTPFYDISLSEQRDLTLRLGAAGQSDTGLTTRQVDGVWDLLQRTPLDSPVHGILALRGKALVEKVITDTVYSLYPRLRSAHVQRLLQECCGLYPCSRVALRLGFTEAAGVDGECGMWRELNTLEYRLQVARRKAAAHLERVEKGVTQQRRWYWRAVVKSAGTRLRLLPFKRADLQPRMEWVRDSVFAFIAFVEIAEKSGDVGVSARTLVERLFCAQIATFAATRRRMRRVEEILADRDAGELPEAEAALLQRLRAELQRCRTRSSDDEAVLDDRVHPLNDRADRAHMQLESSGGAHAMETLKDDVFADQHVARHRHQGAPAIISALQTQNAFKEAQIILRYAPDVSPALRNAPLDVDEVVRKVVEVHETNNYASLHREQQFRPVEYSVCRLYAGKTCIGEGKGETLMEAIQESSQDMVFNYYLGTPRAADLDDAGGSASDAGSSEKKESPKEKEEEEDAEPFVMKSPADIASSRSQSETQFSF